MKVEDRIQDIADRLAGIGVGIFELLRDNRQVDSWNPEEYVGLTILLARTGAWKDFLAEILYRGPAAVVRDLEEIAAEGDRQGMN